MNYLIDLENNLIKKMSIPPTSHGAGTVTGTAVDFRDALTRVEVQISVGAVASGGTAVVKLQQSSNNNTADSTVAGGGAADAYAAINDGEASPTDLSVSISAADANTIVSFTVDRRSEAFLKAVVVVSTAAIEFGVNLIGVRRDNV
jgi:hypothetical protein